MGTVAEEVLQYLTTLPGAEVEVSVEISAKVPAGMSRTVRRIVEENYRTLRFRAHGFDSRRSRAETVMARALRDPASPGACAQDGDFLFPETGGGPHRSARIGGQDSQDGPPGRLSPVRVDEKAHRVRHRSVPAVAGEAEHAEADSHRGVRVPVRSEGAAFIPHPAVRPECGRQEQLPRCPPAPVQAGDEPDAEGSLRSSVPGQAARIFHGWRAEAPGLGRQGSAGLFHRGRSVPVGRGRGGRQPADTGNAPSERRWPARRSRPHVHRVRERNLRYRVEIDSRRSTPHPSRGGGSRPRGAPARSGARPT